MLTRIDRIQLAVPSRRMAAVGWRELLGAEPDGEDRVAPLGATRTRLRAGRGYVELLEPDGAGVVADAVAKRGAHLFAAGAATQDVGALVARLAEHGVEAVRAGDQAFVGADRSNGGIGSALVVSPDREAPRVGSLDSLYEATWLVDDAASTVGVIAAALGLDPAPFVPIESAHYGYAGTLTLFRPSHLHRFEVITPVDRTKTMGRYFDRFGESWYMAFAESDALQAIEERARERGVGYTAVPPPDRRSGGADTLFLHPPTLGGAMLGISRPTMAWSWSGDPDRVEPA